MGSFWKLVSGQTKRTRLSFLLLDIILFCNNNDAIVRAFIYTKQRVFVFGRGEGRAWERGYRDSQTSGLEHCWRQ